MIDPARIWSLTQLPSLPTVAQTLLKLTANPETELRQIVQLVKADPAISAKVVKAANSTFFGVRSEVKGIERAVSLLGPSVSNSLALSFGLTQASAANSPMASHYRDCWKQSIIQASAAAEIAHRIAPASADEFSLCGLLLEVGRLALMSTFETEYRPVLESALEGRVSLSQIEEEWLGIQHAEVGARLMEHWKMPVAVIEAIRWHHAPYGLLEEQRQHEYFPALAAMAIASCAGDVLCTKSNDHARERLDRLARSLLHWRTEETSEFLHQTELSWQQHANLLEFDDTQAPADLMMQANEQLVRLTLRAHVACTQATLRQQLAEQERRDLEFQNKQLQKQALHDPLTKVYNRQFFDEMLDTEAKRCTRCASPIGLIFADVDHFKQINDTYGHQFGDVVLQQIVKVFADAIRNSDILARFGGEEFVILVNQPTERGLERLAEKIRSRVEAEPFLFGDMRVPVTVSLGAAISIPGRDDVDLPHRLIAAADASLYDAKRSGRNRCCIRSMVDENERALSQLVLQHRFSRWLVSKRLLDIPSVSRALLECTHENTRIGELAIQSHYLDDDQVTHIIHLQNDTNERFGTAAIRLGWISEGQLVHLLSLQQENPKQLAAAVVRLGMLSAPQTAESLEEYLLSKIPDGHRYLETEMVTS
ncbi:MAG TPA: GGDEF domain-containing protein [Schlesneria sp.]|jgi:diguanylate cyclase (GGDEF)-like protein